MIKILSHIGFWSMLLLLGACKNTEMPGVENSKILSISNSLSVDLVDIVASPDGGFVVAAKTWKNGNEDFWVLKIDQDFKIEWERVVGGPHNETLQKVLIDKDNNILVGGVSNGYGQDARAISVNKNEVFYFHYFDKSGKTLWENAYPYSNWDFSFYDDRQSMTDIIENSNGDFLMCGRKWHTASSSGGVTVGLTGVLLELNKLGEFKRSFIKQIGGYPWINWEAVFETKNSYAVCWNNNLVGAGYSEIDKMDAGGYSPYDDQKTSIPWNWPNMPVIPGNIANLKMTLNPELLSYNYFFSDEVYRFEYDVVAKKVTGRTIPLGLSKIVSAATTFDNHFILAKNDGTIYETDQNFDIIQSFESNQRVKMPCKLTSGKYVLGVQIDHTINLVQYGKNGAFETN